MREAGGGRCQPAGAQLEGTDTVLRGQSHDWALGCHEQQELRGVVADGPATPAVVVQALPLRTIRFEEPAKNCPICLEDFRDGDALRVLPCSHIFHSVCADKWLAHPEVHVSTLAERTCPMCKTLVFRVAAHGTGGTDRLAAHGTRGTNHGSAV